MLHQLLTLCVVASVSVATMVSEKEPGQRLIVTGQVFAPNGTTPAAGVTIRAYHTDARGYYNSKPDASPRLDAKVVTDKQGRFELRTIRPGGYPGRSDAAHIHFEAWGGGYPKQWLHALEFADDQRMNHQKLAESKARGRFANIVTTTRDARGVLRAQINFKMSKTSNL